MVNLQRRFWLSVAIIPLVMMGISSDRVDSRSVPDSPQLIASSGWRFAFWQRRPRRRLGVRSGACAVSPGLVGKYTIWHDRPLFVWQGKGTQVSVRDRENQTVLWTQPLNATEQEVPYNAQDSLQPGKLYQWQILGTESLGSDLNYWTTFEVMPTERRDQIKSELQTLEQQLRAKRASQEEIALQKADYFANREFWSDAVQTLYEVENPSASFVEQRRSYVANLCSTQPAAAQVN